VKLAVIIFPGSSQDVYYTIKDVLNIESDLVNHENSNLARYDGVILSGGASYGDYLRPGAMAVHAPVMEQVKKFAAEGKPVLGIGNGFQILTEAGLLPGALLKNNDLLFICHQESLVVENDQTGFTSNYDKGEVIQFPIAHRYGNYYCDEESLEKLKDNKQIIFTYQHNPNGSAADIAGIVNEQGNVLGLMPHPERAAEKVLGSEDGIKLFNSIVKNWRESNVTNN